MAEFSSVALPELTTRPRFAPPTSSRQACPPLLRSVSAAVTPAPTGVCEGAVTETSMSCGLQAAGTG